VDCTGMCGASEASPYLQINSTQVGVSSMRDLFPIIARRDVPSEDSEEKWVPHGPDGRAPRVPAPTVYVQTDDVFCATDNLNLAEEGYEDVAQHRCYTKCQAGPVGDGSCAGYLPSHDGPSSNALCLTEAMCRAYCSALDDCHSIDMHATSPRCFLNSARGCGEMVTVSEIEEVWSDGIEDDANYKLVVKQIDNVDDGTMTGGIRGPVSVVSGASTIPAPEVLGVSTAELLRFKSFSFTHGGRFKVCFCDAQLLQGPEYCTSPSEFDVEVGTIHVSSISCLLRDRKYQRGTCMPMYYGGLRCSPN